MRHQETDSPNEDREVTESSDEMHRETDTGKEAELEPRLDDSIQGISSKPLNKRRRKVISNLLYVVQNHPNKEALIKDLQQKHPYNPFSEESANMIHDVGNVEYFEMCETYTKSTMHLLLDDWGNWNCSLQVWHVPAALRAVTTPEPREM